MIKISGVIITYNEEEHLEKCLASLVGIVDEIVVVDSYSTDKTKAICEKFKVRFIPQEFLGYKEQKNFARHLFYCFGAFIVNTRTTFLKWILIPIV